MPAVHQELTEMEWASNANNAVALALGAPRPLIELIGIIVALVRAKGDNMGWEGEESFHPQFTYPVCTIVNVCFPLNLTHTGFWERREDIWVSRPGHQWRSLQLKPASA